jgi:hypothetical protein
LAKFILCSNNEDSFIQIEPGETRYWVRKVNRIKNINVNLLEELIEEIPSFLFFISNRELSTKSQSRMWFTAKQIRTEALTKSHQKEQELAGGGDVRDYIGHHG